MYDAGMRTQLWDYLSGSKFNPLQSNAWWMYHLLFKIRYAAQLFILRRKFWMAALSSNLNIVRFWWSISGFYSGTGKLHSSIKVYGNKTWFIPGTMSNRHKLKVWLFSVDQTWQWGYRCALAILHIGMSVMLDWWTAGMCTFHIPGRLLEGCVCTLRVWSDISFEVKFKNDNFKKQAWKIVKRIC
jgi:hypothetical protein